MRDKVSSGRHANRWAVRALVVLGAVLLVLAMASAYFHDTVLDSDEFADRIVAAASTPEVQAEITSEIVKQIVVLDPDLLLIRPIIEGIVDATVQSRSFETVLRFAVKDLHRSVFETSDDTLTFKLTDMVLWAKVSLTKIDAEAAATIPDDLTDALITFRADESLVDTVQFVETVRLLAFILPIMGFGSFAGAMWLARDRRAAAFEIGIAGIVAGVTLAVVEVIGRFVVVGSADDGRPRAVTATVWGALADDIQRWALTAILVGGIVAGAAWLGRQRISDAQVRRALGALMWPPESRRGGLIWSSGVGLAGVLVITQWELTVQIIATLLGAAMIVSAVTEMRLALERRPEPAGPAIADSGEPHRWSVPVTWLSTAGSLVVLAAVLVLISRSGGGESADATTDPGCNGSVLLCDRPLDQVAFATTHNSMAAANDGFTLGYQTVGIIDQLDAGYRGLLIDAYVGIENDDIVTTDRAPLDDEQRAALVADFGEGVVRAAEALREIQVDAGGDRDLFLCHAFCEVGAVRMSDELARIEQWLQAHPREVLVIIIQDEGPTDKDIERAFETSGLIDMIHSQPSDEPWPTLSEMIESGRRVWVSAEHNPGDLDWYHDAFTYVQDTPHSPTRLEDFSCELFRGNRDSSLFLINQWLSPASPSNADIANSREVLETRLADCDDQRGLFPNLIAVDFSDRGDVLAVVDDLNGIVVDR